MTRVTKANPCPICGKNSWCLIGDKMVLCMRVQSNKPKVLKSGETGWLHPMKDYVTPPKSDLFKGKPRQKSNNEWRGMMDEICKNTPQSHYVIQAQMLGLPAWTLGPHGLPSGYSMKHGAWAFPMYDGFGQIIGIRLRSQSGKKWAVPGSQSGIFVPDVNPKPVMMIVEGPTDTMAGLAMDYYTVGRPSCAGGVHHIKNLIQRCKCQRVVIIADNDEDDYEHPDRPNPGINGAKALAACMVVPTAILVLPMKDLRQFLQKGGTKELMDSIVRAALWKM